MNKRLQGFIAGAVSAFVLACGAAYATVGTKQIEVEYQNIKVYKDNVLCELKDSNGSIIEPFIYNGTTYMPVRGTANLADMQVTWDGSTSSVYLWDEMVPSGTYLMEVCEPYEKSSYCDIYLSSKGENFEMAGEKYSNGIKLGVHGWYALFNLNSKYSTIECTVGHITDNQVEKTVYFIVDGKTVKEVTIGSEELPKKISIPVNYGLQLKIMSDKSDERGYMGIGNITVR